MYIRKEIKEIMEYLNLENDSVIPIIHAIVMKLKEIEENVKKD